MKKFFASLLLIVFIILLPTYLILLNLGNLIEEPTIFKEALAESNIYEEASDLAVAQLISAEGLDQLEGMNIIEKKELEEIIDELLPPEFLQETVEQAIDQGFSLITDEGKEIKDLDLVIDLTDIKTKAPALLTGKVKEKFDQLPVCNETELIDLEKKLKDGFVFPSCRPSDVNSDKFTGDMEANIAEMTKDIPSQFDVAKLITGELVIGEQKTEDQGSTHEMEKDINEALSDSQLVFSAIQSVLRWTPVLLTIILLGIGLLTYKPISSLFRWVGFSLLIPGTFLFLMANSLRFLPFLDFNEITINGEASQEIVEIIGQMVEKISNHLYAPFWWQGLTILLAGIALITISFFVKSSDLKTGNNKVESKT